MADKDSKRRPQASLTDLLAEHTRIAEQERQEIESKLREKEEEERRRREEEEARQKELLRQRLEEEKRRAQERFQRQQEKEQPAQEPAAAPVAATTAPVAVQPERKSHTLLAVAVTVVLMAGAAAGAWFLFLNDPSAELNVMSRQGVAVAAASTRQADVLVATWKASQHAREQAGTIEDLKDKLATASADIERLEAKMTEAQKAAADAEKAAEEARLAAEENGRSTRRSRPKPKKDTGIKVRTGIFSGDKIVE